jgi:ADP-heptose:LPS heptosyltransferase
LFFVQQLLNARYSAGEIDGLLLRRLLSFSVKRDWHKSFLEAQEQLAAAIGVSTPLEQPRISVHPGEVNWARELLHQSGIQDQGILIGLHCSSAVPDKAWPAIYFGQVVKELARTFKKVTAVTFGLQEDQAASGEAQLAAGGNVHWVDGTGKWNIRQTLAMLNRCNLLISGDTGVMHMAAAVGTPTVSVFGPTSPIRRAPLQSGGLAVVPQTSCHPCFKLRWSGCRCIRTISVDRVTAAAVQNLRAQGIGQQCVGSSVNRAELPA